MAWYAQAYSTHQTTGSPHPRGLRVESTGPAHAFHGFTGWMLSMPPLSMPVGSVGIIHLAPA